MTSAIEADSINQMKMPGWLSVISLERRGSWREWTKPFVQPPINLQIF